MRSCEGENHKVVHFLNTFSSSAQESPSWPTPVEKCLHPMPQDRTAMATPAAIITPPAARFIRFIDFGPVSIRRARLAINA